MRPFKGLINADEAMDIINKNVRAIEEKEDISIDAADRRILAEDVKAAYDVPHFNRSSMDGYAVRSEDTSEASAQNPKMLTIVGEVFAGDNTGLEVRGGECVKIATGAPLPDSCDAVIMVEDTEQQENMVIIHKPARPFENVSKAGEDIKRGEVVLKKGLPLDPSKIGALAALGLRKVWVIRRPNIGIISTGNEIIPLGQKLEKGRIYDINTYTLKTLAERNFCEPFPYGIIEDNAEALKKALENAIGNDMVVFSGGSSVGERDMLVDVLGGAVFFHGVRIKPGKPTLFAAYKGKPVFGLPGFPTSCLMNGYLFLAPALRKMAGAPERERRIIKARMAHDVKLSGGRRKNITVRLEGEYAFSVYKESSTITSLARAEGFITVDEGINSVKKGEEVEVELFSW